MQREAICFLNGSLDSQGLNRRSIEQAALIIAVDGGLVHCDRMHIQPHLIVGDWDSVPSDLREKYGSIQSVTLKRDKDETDFEKALEAVDFKKVDQVSVLGWKSRARTDHLLGNLFMAAKFPGKVLLDAFDELVFVLTSQNGEVHLRTSAGQVCSIYPLSGQAAVRSMGLRWELDGKRPLNGGFFSQSNECLSDRISLEVLSGSAVCILQKN
jgi:thiamine pyrophosphokinase